MNLLISGVWQNAGEYVKEIETLGHDVVFIQREEDDLPCGYDWVEGTICNGLFLHHPINRFPNLKYIQLTSAGFDRVDMAYIRHHNITIYNAKGVYTIPMAEYAVTAVLSLYKKRDIFSKQQEKHEWRKIREIRELSGKRVAIIGNGEAGQACGRLFMAFGCEVTWVNRTIQETERNDRIVGLEQIDQIIADVDVVIVTIALTDETRGLVKARKIRPDAVLVNISRSGTVDLEGALCHMVLDVFENEPLEENDPLWNKATITPHNAFIGEGNATRLSTLIMGNLRQGVGA